MMWTNVLSFAASAVILTVATSAGSAGAPSTPAPPPQTPAAPTATPFPASAVGEILAAHNKYRTAVGVPLLTWSDDLAAASQVWVNTLSAEQRFAHDHHLKNQGENVWIGTTDGYSLTEMVDTFGEEEQYFHNGTFPNVSRSGTWELVGHYTQIVWRNTTQVGCAGVAGSDGNYRFVCRYTPPGNVIGQRVF